MRSIASSPFSTIFPPSPSTCTAVLTGGGSDSTTCLAFRPFFLPFFEMWGEGKGPVALGGGQRGRREEGKGKGGKGRQTLQKQCGRECIVSRAIYHLVVCVLPPRSEPLGCNKIHCISWFLSHLVETMKVPTIGGGQ